MSDATPTRQAVLCIGNKMYDVAITTHSSDGCGSIQKASRPEELPMRFAERLNEILGERNLTVTNLSALSGVHRNTIDNYINRGTNPTLPVLKALKDALGCSWEYLLGD